MAKADKKCGGKKKNGGKCTLAAGWGTENELGPCKHHLDQIPQSWEELVSERVPKNLKPFWKEAKLFLMNKKVWTWGNAMMVVVALNRWQRFLETDEIIEEEGTVRKDPNQGGKGGRKGKHPAFTANKQSVNQLRQILNSLGVTTKSMQQITFPDPKEERSRMKEIIGSE